MFDIATLFKSQHPEFSARHPRLTRMIVSLGRWMWMEKVFQQFAQENPGLNDIDLIKKGFEQINFDLLFAEGIDNIPSSGRVIIIANHPLGYLDGVGLLKAISAVRPDVKMLVNTALHNMLNMKQHTVAVDNFRGRLTKSSFAVIKKHMQQEGVLVLFPSGLVSRRIKGEVIDLPWSSSFLRFAEDFNAPILPLYIDGKNSKAFYRLSSLTDPIAKTVLIVRELVMMKLLREIFTEQANQRVKAYVGTPVVVSDAALAGLTSEEKTAWFRQRLYALKPKSKN